MLALCQEHTGARLYRVLPFWSPLPPPPYVGYWAPLLTSTSHALASCSFGTLCLAFPRHQRSWHWFLLSGSMAVHMKPSPFQSGGDLSVCACFLSAFSGETRQLFFKEIMPEVASGCPCIVPPVPGIKTMKSTTLAQGAHWSYPRHPY